MRRRIGILGGTFDPPHLGHLVVSQAAIEQLELEHVLFVPAGFPPHKECTFVSAVEDRVEMVRLAIAGNPRFALTTDDIGANRPSYTWELLERLQRDRHDAELCFIMGGDSLIEFPTWRRPERILELATLTVARRPGFHIGMDAMDVVPGLRRNVQWIEAPLCDVSSTMIRSLARQRRSIRHLVPDTVASYIVDRGLYTADRYRDPPDT